MHVSCLLTSQRSNNESTSWLLTQCFTVIEKKILPTWNKTLTTKYYLIFESFRVLTNDDTEFMTEQSLCSFSYALCVGLDVCDRWSLFTEAFYCMPPRLDNLCQVKFQIVVVSRVEGL